MLQNSPENAEQNQEGFRQRELARKRQEVLDLANELSSDAYKIDPEEALRHFVERANNMLD